MISRRCSDLTAAVDAAELSWLRERGVRIDHKGRIIVRLPQPDDELGFQDDEAASIAALMRRDVDRRNGSSRGRRHSPHIASYSAVAKAVAKRRRGRPIVGDEARIRVQTTIDPRTRDILRSQHCTLADVFDACARELANGL